MEKVYILDFFLGPFPKYPTFILKEEGYQKLHSLVRKSSLIINRPGVAGAVLQTALSLIN